MIDPLLGKHISLSSSILLSHSKFADEIFIHLHEVGAGIKSLYILPSVCSYTSGPGCSKLTTSLVNNSLKFTSSDTQIR